VLVCLAELPHCCAGLDGVKISIAGLAANKGGDASEGAAANPGEEAAKDGAAGVKFIGGDKKVGGWLEKAGGALPNDGNGAFVDEDSPEREML